MLKFKLQRLDPNEWEQSATIVSEMFKFKLQRLDPNDWEQMD